jgi:hypothetical protein
MKWKERGRAASWHLLASLVIASLAAMLVFVVWFPYPYREVSGGRELFELVVGVDVILGPLLTFIVFNRSKPNKELWRDLAIIALLQLAALGYGLWTVHTARPIYLVHEVDRFKVVTRADIDPAELSQAPPELQKLPLSGIRVIGVRLSRNNSEMFSAVESAIAGKDLSAMPSRWQELDATNQAQIRQRARSAAFLRGRATDGGVELTRVITKAGVQEGEVIALPLVSRRDDWSVLMSRDDLRIIGYVPIDAF